MPKSQAPPKWSKVYESIRSWRSTHPADVDVMGCDVLAQKDVPERVRRYQTLVALQLSSQTKDPVVSQAIKNLQSHPDGGLTVESVLSMPDQVLNSYISKVGFHNRKTIYLKQTAAILKEKYDSDIPRSVEEMMDLPGVGPKMAYLAAQSAWKEYSMDCIDF